MHYFKFINRRLQWQNPRGWWNAGAPVPYNLYHRKHLNKLKFVSNHHFNVYCDAPRKLSKLYWRLHKIDIYTGK